MNTFLIVSGLALLGGIIWYSLHTPEKPQDAVEDYPHISPPPVYREPPTPPPSPDITRIIEDTIAPPEQMHFWQVKEWVAHHDGFVFNRWSDLPYLNEARVKAGYPPIVRRAP